MEWNASAGQEKESENENGIFGADPGGLPSLMT